MPTAEQHAWLNQAFGVTSLADVAGAASGGLPQPMGADCKIVHNKVPGPVNHVLCATHGHVVDTNTHMVIARSIDDYRRKPSAHANAASNAAQTAAAKVGAGAAAVSRGAQAAAGRVSDAAASVSQTATQAGAAV